MSRSILEISKESIQNNVIKLYQYTGKKIIAVIKADGYGIGALHLCKILENIDYVSAYAVACVEEGIELRKAGFKKKILILGGVLKGEGKYLQRYNLTPVISHREHLKAIEGLDIKFHLKWDTGMGRLGFLEEETIDDERVEGLMTHLSTPLDKEFSMYQISKFEKIIKIYKKVPYIHLQSSAGIVYNVPFTTHIRIGLALHGEYPSVNYPVKLERVYTLKAKLISVKKVPSNYPISYSKTYVTDKEKTIGVVAFGYADGLMKSLSNVGFLYYKGKPVKILGNITMDMTVIDLDGTSAKVGDYIEIVGEHQSFSQLAKVAGTIPYEIMCNLSKRIRREVH